MTDDQLDALLDELCSGEPPEAIRIGTPHPPWAIHPLPSGCVLVEWHGHALIGRMTWVNMILERRMAAGLLPIGFGNDLANAVWERCSK